MKERYDFSGEEQEGGDRPEVRIVDSLNVLKRLLNKYFDEEKRFQKRIVDHISSEKGPTTPEIRQETRELFLAKAKELLSKVCMMNYDEFEELESAYLAGQPFVFNSYIQYDLPSAGKAKAGDVDLSAVTFRVVATKAANNSGDEMRIRFATREDIILDNDTSEREVQDWFDNIQEVIVEYDRKTALGFEPEIYAISGEGFMSFPGRFGFTAQDYRDLANLDKRQQIDEQEAQKLQELYDILTDPNMELTPLTTTPISA